MTLLLVVVLLYAVCHSWGQRASSLAAEGEILGVFRRKAFPNRHFNTNAMSNFAKLQSLPNTHYTLKASMNSPHQDSTRHILCVSRSNTFSEQYKWQKDIQNEREEITKRGIWTIHEMIFNISLSLPFFQFSSCSKLPILTRIRRKERKFTTLNVLRSTVTKKNVQKLHTAKLWWTMWWAMTNIDRLTNWNKFNIPQYWRRISCYGYTEFGTKAIL